MPEQVQSGAENKTHQIKIQKAVNHTKSELLVSDSMCSGDKTVASLI